VAETENRAISRPNRGEYFVSGGSSKIGARRGIPQFRIQVRQVELRNPWRKLGNPPSGPDFSDSGDLPIGTSLHAYRVKGTKAGFFLTRSPVVAFSPNFMRDGADTFERRKEGDTLWLRQKSTTEPLTDTTWRLIRVE